MQRDMMKEEEMEANEPVSPTGQYFNSSALSVSVLGIFESEIPIDDSPTKSFLEDVFIPVNPRFSSVMITDEKGIKHWKRVKVKIEDHVHVPVFPAGLSPEKYDGYVQEYFTEIAMEQLPRSRPLWDIHIIKYLTSTAAGILVVKLHHAMGDGYSLMGGIFSCLKRADDPSLPLTFPTKNKVDGKKSVAGLGMEAEVKKEGSCKWVPAVSRVLSVAWNTAMDFGWSLAKSKWVEDDQTAVRSGGEGVEFRPLEISTVGFELEHLRQVKAKVGGTINDVITGIVFYGIQLYMEKASAAGGTIGTGFNKNSRVTALVLLNTRNIDGYQTVEEMMKPGARSPWGNQFGFLHAALPFSSDEAEKTKDPLNFIYKARSVIQRSRSSLAVYFTGRLLEVIRKTSGPESTARHIHTTLKNASMTVSNLVGPMEKMGIANHPCKGLYFMVVGVPQSLTVTLISYNGTLKLAMGTEKGYIDSHLLVSCMKTAFTLIMEAANIPNIEPTR